MIKSAAGKRDLGSGEVSRYLLSEPCYHSEFEYVKLNLNVEEKEINLQTNNNKENEDNYHTFKKNIIDFYANRFNESLLDNKLDKIECLIDFVQYFKLDKEGNLQSRRNPLKIVVLPFPKYRPNKKDKR